MTAAKTVPEVDHGILRPVEPPKPKEKWLPRALKNMTLIHFGLPWAEAAQKHGVYKMQALKDCSVSGHRVQTGEKFQAVGPDAYVLWTGDDAIFLDEDGLREKELLLERTAKELAAPVDYQNAPQFRNPGAASIKRDKISI